MNVPPAVDLAWHRGPGAESCVDAGELAERVAMTLGRQVHLASGASADVGGASASGERVQRLDGHVDPRTGGGWVAVVEVGGATAGSLRREVTLDASDCRQFDESIVLVVALMADVTLPRIPMLVAPIRRPPVSVAIGPDVAVARGMLPGVATGLGFASDVLIPPHWHIATWAHAWPTSEALDDGSGARLAAWTFGASPCLGTPMRGATSLFVCAGAAVGVIYSSGVGLEVSRSRALAYVETEFRAGIRLRLSGPIALRLELGAVVPVARDEYQFTAADGAAHPVFRTAAVVPLARFGLEFRAP